MSIASEITRINNNIAAAYTALDGKGATLPAEGSQNSANLADTIDTITTGGGGGGRDPLFDEVWEYAESLGMTASGTSAVAAGWEVTAANDLNVNSASGAFDWNNINSNGGSAICGYVFADDIPDKIYVQSRLLRASDGATITLKSTGSKRSVWEVDFSNATNKYILFEKNAIHNGQTSNEGFALNTSINNLEAECQNYLATFVRYSCLSYKSSTYTSSNPKVFSTANDGSVPKYICKTTLFTSTSKVLEDIDISENLLFEYEKSNNTFTFAWNDIPMTLFWARSNKISKTKMASFVRNFVNGTDKLSTTLVSQVLFDTDGYATAYEQIYSQEEFLPIIDCSGSSPSGYWYFGAYPYNNDVRVPSYQCKNIKIILPSSMTQADFCNVGHGAIGKSLSALSIDSIRFMANNAPTVSSKTIALGIGVQNYITNFEPSIKSTFESKGWSFRTY